MSYMQQERVLQQEASKDLLAAFDKFYHDEVVMIEASGEVRKGKANNRKFEEEWLQNLKEVHGGGINGITSNEEEGITMSETWMDATFKDGNRRKMEEVSVKKWEGDKVVRERFYYHMGNG